ncbi:acyl carrier protein [bacterium]|nr:acyl carrier protein [bacterium]
MNDLEKIVMETIQNAASQDGMKITKDTPLIGDGSVLDSMKLVEVCLALEDIADDHDFEFDWTSEAAMSKSRSMFRTAGTLVVYFCQQAQQA